MKLAWLWLLILLPQEDAAARLKRDGWRGVQSFLDQGEVSRAALEKAAAGDGDVAFLAAAALGELDCRKAGEFAPVPRTRGLRGDAATVVAGLFKAAGLEVSLEGLPEKSLSIPDDLTFAEALDAASRELNVEFVQAENGSWKAEGPLGKGARFASGRVRACVVEINQGTTWSPGLAPRCIFWIKARLDGFGRFRQMPMFGDLRVVEALDEFGRDLRPKRGWNEDYLERETPKSKDRRATFTLSLHAPDLKSTTLARLRLAVDFAFRKKDDVITFDKLDGARNVTKKVGDVEATLLRSGRDDDVYRVEVQLRAPGIEARIAKDDEDRGGDLIAHLLDAAGKGWEEGGGSSGSSSREYDFKRDYRNPGNVGPPATFSVSLITEVETRSVFLEFRDVPLR